MSLNLTHNENLKTLDDVGRHLELEAERREATKPNSFAHMVESSSRKASRPKRKFSEISNKQGLAAGPAPKKAKVVRRKRGKRGAYCRQVVAPPDSDMIVSEDKGHCGALYRGGSGVGSKEEKAETWRSLLLLSQITLINFVSFTISQTEPLGYFCNYTSSDTYQTNRDTLLSSLSTGTNQYGFYSSSYGENPDTVYAMVLCRADVELESCRECINNATATLGLCPDNKAPTGWPGYNSSDKDGIVWYDNCTVRYSSQAMEGIMAGDPRIFNHDIHQNVTSVDVEQFKDALTNLLNNLRVQAAGGGTQRKFASGSAPGPANYTIYALTQCTPDLSTQKCGDCLQGAIDNYPLCCNTSAGGRVLRPSCNFRYEIGPFFGDIPSGESNNGTGTIAFAGEGKNRTRTFIIIIASVTTFVIVLMVFIYIILSKKYPGKPTEHAEESDKNALMGQTYSLESTLRTGNAHDPALS
ncbi:hypothetical protein Vadar_034410 [Vaccinium darrowii]|uniref:Uncharacterized protein n=1 Tax=Vaccinium darrowii TaxID=229202 RepID=A0ACB7X6H0_9ERIC|nr:hypothetical protein Vadar_034410 [Vaccinium darrowii]